jgi:cysteine desulfurase
MIHAMNSIYLDNNATTPLLPAVAAAMRPFLAETYGNPASAHHLGRRARQVLEDARERVAGLLDADPDEVIFTSGATEANNLAIFGHAGQPPAHVLVSPIEHPSVLEPVRRLGEIGFDVEQLPVDQIGTIAVEELQKRLRSDTRLVAIQLANHETGVVQSIGKLAQITHHSPVTTHHSPFHCDATQAVGKRPVRFHELGVTSLAFSAHKFHGPNGVGALLLRRGCRLRPLFAGGHQQQGRRPGSESIMLAVGLATALELFAKEAESRHARVLASRRRLLEGLRSRAAPVILNGPEEGMPGFGLPHTVNVSFPGCRADALLMNLDLAGVACSTGSACSSGSLLPSPVLQAMGMPTENLHSAMRFSLSALLSEDEIDQAVGRIAAVVCRLRQTAK